MKGLAGVLVLAAVALFFGPTLAVPVPIITVSPGTASDIVITKDNTLNATAPTPSDLTVEAHSLATAATSTTERLPLDLVNNFSGGQINAYVTGLDTENRLVMLMPDGAFYYPSAQPGQVTPQLIDAAVVIPLGPKGSTTRITIPGYISAARIYFAEGNLSFYTVWSEGNKGPSLVQPSAANPKDPSSSVNWGFVELTNNASGGLYANISYVDFVALVLGMSMQTTDGAIQAAKGLHPNAVSAICQSLVTQEAKDGMPWSDLCQASPSGQPLRIMAPIDYASSDPGVFGTYYTSYVDQVWSRYTTETLTVNTQSPAGHVECKVSNDVLICNGDNRPYAKPSSTDIFGCNSGPFGILETDNGVHRAVVPRLCAAFNRGTLLMDGGHFQPGLQAHSYYQASPVNWYSAFIHQEEVDGKGYAFSYDDVNPDGDVDQSGVVAASNPALLTVIVGGP